MTFKSDFYPDNARNISIALVFNAVNPRFFRGFTGVTGEIIIVRNAQAFGPANVLR